MKKETASILNIARLSISSDARTDREELNMILSLLDQQEQRVPGPNNAMRCAVRYKVDSIGTWNCEQTGERCKLLIQEARKTENPVDLWIHLQTVGKSVDYSKRLLRIGIDPSGKPFKDESTTEALNPSESAAMKRLEAEQLTDPDHLVAFGTDNAFNKHIRQTAETILAQGCTRIWNRAGVWLTTAAEHVEKIELAKRLFSDLSAGSFTCETLSLEDSPANRQRIADELTEQYLDQLKDIEAKLEEVAPYLKKLEDDLLGIGENVVRIEKTLQVSIPVQDRLLEVGALIRDAKEKEEAEKEAAKKPKKKKKRKVA